ncbi:hypothetical protein [Sphingomonas cynarae]
MFTLITLILRLRAMANQAAAPAVTIVAANDTGVIERIARAA